MATENKTVSANQNIAPVKGDLNPETYRVDMHIVSGVTSGDRIQAKRTFDACASAGLPPQLVTKKLVEGHGYADERRKLDQVPVGIKPDEVGAIGCETNPNRVVSWEKRGINDFGYQLGNGDEEPSEEGLIKLERGIEKAVLSQSVIQIAVVIEEEATTAPQIGQQQEQKVYNFGALPLEKAA